MDKLCVYVCKQKKPHRLRYSPLGHSTFLIVLFAAWYLHKWIEYLYIKIEFGFCLVFVGCPVEYLVSMNFNENFYWHPSVPVFQQLRHRHYTFVTWLFASISLTFSPSLLWIQFIRFARLFELFHRMHNPFSERKYLRCYINVMYHYCVHSGVWWSHSLWGFILRFHLNIECFCFKSWNSLSKQNSRRPVESIVVRIRAMAEWMQRELQTKCALLVEPQTPDSIHTEFDKNKTKGLKFMQKLWMQTIGALESERRNEHVQKRGERFGVYLCIQFEYSENVKLLVGSQPRW